MKDLIRKILIEKNDSDWDFMGDTPNDLINVVVKFDPEISAGLFMEKVIPQLKKMGLTHMSQGKVSIERYFDESINRIVNRNNIGLIYFYDNVEGKSVVRGGMSVIDRLGDSKVGYNFWKGYGWEGDEVDGWDLFGLEDYKHYDDDFF